MNQADIERSWDQVEKILEVLEKGVEFLSVENYQSQTTSKSSLSGVDSNSVSDHSMLYDDPSLSGDENAFAKEQQKKEDQEKNRQHGTIQEFKETFLKRNDSEIAKTVDEL